MPKQSWSHKTNPPAPNPLLGWIPPEERDPETQHAHEDIMNACPRFALARPSLPKGTKIILNDFLRKPEVVADIGEIFTGFRQLTGSCVGVSEGDSIAVLSAVQRMLSDSPTKAMVPWWAFPYGRSRFKSGMRSKGEGSVTSIMGAVVRDEGCFAINEPGFNLPVQFDKSDGWAIPAAQEMNWSDGDETLVTQYLNLAKQFPVGGMSPLEDIDGVAASIINGYPVENGCNYYVGNGQIVDGGGTPYVRGSYNGRGGHATVYSAYWEHPSAGPLYGYWNQWNASTYPKDPGGLHRCMVWVIEAEARRLFQLGGNGGETMSWSHLNYHPAQPKVLDWAQI